MIHIWGGQKKKKINKKKCMTCFLFFLQCIMVTRTVRLHNTLSKPWNSLRGRTVAACLSWCEKTQIARDQTKKRHILSCDHEPKIYMKSYKLNKWSRLSGGCGKKEGPRRGKSSLNISQIHLLQSSSGDGCRGSLTPLSLQKLSENCKVFVQA